LGIALLAWTWVLSLSLFIPSFLPLLGVLFYEVCQGFITLQTKSGKREKMNPLDFGKVEKSSFMEIKHA
jgi:hypothetical protein